jgi:hypothetical protein
VGRFELGNEPSDSIKCGGFLDELRNDKLLKKDAASRRFFHALIEQT